MGMGLVWCEGKRLRYEMILQSRTDFNQESNFQVARGRSADELKRTHSNSSKTRYEYHKTWRSISHRSEWSWGRRASFHWCWKRGWVVIWVLPLDVVVVDLILLGTSMISNEIREDLQFHGRLSYSLLGVELWQFWSSRSIIQLENQPNSLWQRTAFLLLRIVLDTE